MVRKAVCLALGLLTSTATQLHAEDGDWSQWRGPARDGIASSQKLLKSWPEQGPKLAWSYKEAGLGYSSSAISNGKLYTMGQRGEDCVAICIDAKSGKELWSQRFDRGTKPDDYLTGWGGVRAAPRPSMATMFIS